MGIDMKKMRRTYDENQRGGDIWTPDTGVTLLYIHPPCRDNDEHEPTAGLNHIPLVVHYGLGRDRQMAVCLDHERNPVIRHPFVRALLKKRKIKVGKTCPVDEAISEGTMSADAADEATPNTRFLWGVTPIAYKPSISAEKWTKLTPKPKVALVGATLYNGFMDTFFEAGDITDMDAAVYVQVVREGKGRFDTKYEVKVLNMKGMSGSVAKPAKLPPAFRRLINKAIQVEGDCDLFKIVANMVKSTDDVTALVSGVSVGEGDDDGEEFEGMEDDGALDGDDSELLDGDDDGEGEGEDEGEGDDEGDDELLDGDDDDGSDLLDGDDDAVEDDGDDLLDGEGDDGAEDASEDTEGASEGDGDSDDLGLDELDAELERISKRRAAKAAGSKKGSKNAAKSKASAKAAAPAKKRVKPKK